MIWTCERFEDLGAWEALWRALEVADPSATVFQSYAWVRAAWEHLLSGNPGNRLHILVWRRDEARHIALPGAFDGARDTSECVLFPLYLDGRGTLRIILDIQADVCGALCGSPAAATRCAREVAQHVRDTPAIRGLRLCKVPQGAPWLAGLSAFLPEALLCKDTFSCALSLPRTDDFPAALEVGAKMRKTIRQGLRKAEASPFRWHSIETAPFPKAKLVALRDAMIASGARGKDFLEEAFLAFAETLYREGLCAVAETRGGMSLCLVHGEWVLFWISLTCDPKRLSLLNLRTIAERARERATVFDFGTGFYAYKAHTGRPAPTLRLRLRYVKHPLRFCLAVAEEAPRSVRARW